MKIKKDLGDKKEASSKNQHNLVNVSKLYH